MTEEIWKDIEQYQGLYQVSNLGRVRSVDRWLTYKGDSKKFWKGCIIKTNPNNCGYLRVGLVKDRKQIKYFVHRLVAESFLDNTCNFSQVNHIDGNKENNRVENLEWCDKYYNIKHSIDTGLRSDMIGTNNHQSKLDDQKVREIKMLLKKDVTCTEIANIFSVSISVISCIKTGKRWTHVE